MDRANDFSFAKAIQDEFYKIIATGKVTFHITEAGKYREKIYPEIAIADDKHSHILQVTDLIAVSLNHAFREKFKANGQSFDLEKLPENNKYLSAYWPLFKKDPQGKVAGWGIKVWW